MRKRKRRQLKSKQKGLTLAKLNESVRRLMYPNADPIGSLIYERMTKETRKTQPHKLMFIKCVKCGEPLAKIYPYCFPLPQIEGAMVRCGKCEFIAH